MAKAMELPEWKPDALGRAVEAIAREETVRATGVRIESDQVAAILSNAPRKDGRPVLPRVDFAGSHFAGDPDFASACFAADANFSRAIFDSDARFAGTCFAQEAHFERAEFKGDARFTAARFEAEAWFDHAVVAGEAEFSDACFGGETGFNGAAVRGQAQFDGATFDKDVRFEDVTFIEDAWFGKTVFCTEVWFDEATFAADAWFGDARFCGGSWFGGTVFCADASFLRAEFEEARDIGPILVFETLSFQGADFFAPVRIEAAARRASWEAARFRAGGDLSLRWAEVNLQRAEFGGPSLLTALPPSKDHPALGRERRLPNGRWECCLDNNPVTGFAPALISLRGAKLAQLAMSEVDLRRCSFNGAQGLERLRLERVRFAESPSTYSRHWPCRWTRRQTLAEEHRWRRDQEAWGWDGSDTHAPEWVPDGDSPTAEQLAALYRALRKGREDIKDEPGAADFYYGEMEMRRQPASASAEAGPGFVARRTPAVERWLIGIYWLVSGYALRSSRVLATLGLVILLSAALFEAFGFKSAGVQPRVAGVSQDGGLVYETAKPASRTFPEVAIDAVTLSAATTASVLSSTPTRPLSRAGEIFRVLLRILGPVLVGLALLSFRGRVKR